METICLPLNGEAHVHIGPIELWYKDMSFDKVCIVPNGDMDLWIERCRLLQSLLESVMIEDCILWTWNDPKLHGTKFVVTTDLCVNYYYKGSVEKTGSDTKAALRAYKAWKRWVNKPDGLWCQPARPELYAFYANFPEVRCV